MSHTNFYQAVLVERTEFTDALALFRFRPESPFTFIPGQYATLALEHSGKLIQRPYSIVSSPLDPFLEFFIELIPDGDLTPLLWELQVNDKVLVRNRIVGRFTLDDTLNRHLMLATVTGVAPFISMARTQRLLLERGEPLTHQMAILHGASYAVEFGPYKDELAELSRSGWLSYFPTISRPWEDDGWNGETARVEDVVRKYADQLGYDFTNSVAYACGHPQMIENTKGILTRGRFPQESIREEKYFTIKDG
jgi:ferredoxin--NADP+ reductase